MYTVIFESKSTQFRIIQIPDGIADMESLKGDDFNPAVTTGINPELLRCKEIAFEQEVIEKGVFGYALEERVGKYGWVTVSIRFGFVGAYDAKSGKYNHYIIDKYKSQIAQLEKELDEQEKQSATAATALILEFLKRAVDENAQQVYMRALPTEDDETTLEDLIKLATSVSNGK